MKIYWLIFISVFFWFNLEAQNLLRNVNFEHGTACPDGISQIEKLEEWILISSSPDYFNCSYYKRGPNFPMSAVYSGSGSIGILASFNDNISKSEAIGQILTSPLLPDRFYRLSFMARSESVGSHSDICREMEIHGFKNEFNADTNFAHLSEKESSIYLGKSEMISHITWELKTINFVPTDSIHVLAISMSEGMCRQYVMLDELTLRNIEIDDFNDGTVCSVFPNPSMVGSDINIASNHEIHRYDIYNVQGNLIVSQSVNFNNKTISLMEAGVYFIVLKIGDETFIKKIIVVKD